MSNITTAFTEVIYRNSLNQFNDKNAEFAKRGLEIRDTVTQKHDWRCNTYSTDKSEYDLRKDPLFKDLVTICEQETDAFAREFGVIGRAKCSEAWINLANPGAYQEYHIHAKSHFSLVYYVDTPINSGNTVFASHEKNTDMFPLPTHTLTPPNFKTYFMNPKNGDVVIFRSNLEHMVEPNQSDSVRISISMNMIIEE